MATLISLLSAYWPQLSIIATVCVVIIAIYRNAYKSGKTAEKQKAIKEEIKRKTAYEEGYNMGLNMSAAERAEWLRKRAKSK